MIKKATLKLVLVLTMALSWQGVVSQETTGTLKGIVYNQENVVLPFAKVSIQQTSTGANYGTLADETGYFVFNQLSPDDSYRLKITAVGYEDYLEENVVIRLGQTTERAINVQPSSESIELDQVVITADPTIKKNGNETTITSHLLTSVPTINRSLTDVTRVLPEANLNSFGGGNYRFNNLSIDGSATNDVFGFQEPSSGASGAVASGTPGGLAGTQPIGFGAIQDISVKIAPFDVTFGNFTGASINAVTKSGTNTFEGNIYGFGKSDLLLGRFAGGVLQPSSELIDIQSGLSFGGPLIKNKLFFYTNIEFTYRNEPLLYMPGSEGAAIPLDLVNQIRDTLIARYNYDPGAVVPASLQRQNTKLFFKLDYFINQNHKLSIRNNFVTGFSQNLEWTPNFFNFSRQGYTHNSRNNSIVAELKSNMNDKFYNKLNLSYSNIHDSREFDGSPFPHLEISYNAANTIFAGTYREASIYGLDVNTYQLTDNLVYYRKQHTFTFGGSVEFNQIEYRFLSAWNGRWQYSSPSNFFADLPSRIRGVYNVDNNDFDYNRQTPSAEYAVMLGGLYAQDEFRINKRLSITVGVRMDLQWHPGDFPLSQEITTTPEFAVYENKINSKPQVNPRFGFNYQVTKNKKINLRGGSGLFTGRIPFLWYAYPHYISGIQYNNIDVKPTGTTPITTDLSDLASLQPGLTEINLIDNGFKLPRDWKNNLAIEIKLPGKLLLTLEATYSKTLNGLLFQSINGIDSVSTFTGSDNRPYFLASGAASKINDQFTNVFLLTNTPKGYRYNLTVNLARNGEKLVNFLGYSYGKSFDLTSSVRNSHAANYEWNQSIVANDPRLSYSNFDLRHKIISYHFYNFKLKKSLLKVGFVYNGRSGSPFSFIYEGDINRDGSAKNDLLYVPATSADIQFQAYTNADGVLVSAETQWAQLDQYISNNDYLNSKRGDYTERNGARTPWNHQVDLRLSYEQPLFKGKNKLEITFDLFNAPNLVNKNWGKQHFVPNVQNAGVGLIDFVKIENGNPVYQFKNPTGTPWQIDPINSRWQGQIGVIYHF